MLPSCADWYLPITFNKVDFPEPFLPTRPIRAFWSILTEISSNTVCEQKERLKCLMFIIYTVYRNNCYMAIGKMLVEELLRAQSVESALSKENYFGVIHL